MLVFFTKTFRTVTATEKRWTACRTNNDDDDDDDNNNNNNNNDDDDD